MAEIPCILCVEDNNDDYLLFSIAARRTDIPLRLQRVTTAQEGLKYLHGRGPFSDRKRHPLPCLIVSNLKLSGSTSTAAELIRQIREHTPFQSLPIAILSGSTDQMEIGEVKAAGAVVFLHKTSSLAELTEMIRDLLGQYCTL